MLRRSAITSPGPLLVPVDGIFRGDPLLSESESVPAPNAPSPQELKQALKAFRKRLRLTRLDAESNLGGGPMSGGTSSGIVAITPPNQYPRSIWDELVRQGKLTNASHGMYSLVGD